MEQFTPYEYVMIAVANAFGLDQLKWSERIEWAKDNMTMLLHDLSSIRKEAKEPMAFIKACNALRDVRNGKPTGFIMGLDATSSGIQIMGALTGCVKTCEHTNVIDTGERKDVYLTVSNIMEQKCGTEIGKAKCKPAVMTHYYNSKAEPIKVFGKGSKALETFYVVLSEMLTGAEECMADINSCWQPNQEVTKWRLPDGHTAFIRNKSKEAMRINSETLGASFTYVYKQYGPQRKGTSLPANVIHSIDGYCVREIVKRAYAKGIKVLPIHDCFYASPLYIGEVRQLYNDLLAEIHETNLLQSILRDITGDKHLEYLQFRDDLGSEIRKSNYALC